MIKYTARATGTWEDYSYNLETGESVFTWEDGSSCSAPPIDTPPQPDLYWEALKFWCAAHPWEPIRAAK